MTGIFTLFIISILGLVVMFWFKLYEIKSGKTIYPEHIRKSADNMVVKTIDKAYITGTRVGQLPIKDLTTKAVGNVAKHVGDGVSKVYKKAINSDSKITNLINGKKVLSRNEKRSDFLNDIEEHKRNNGGGEIEG